jgi:TatD DNase family protein
MLFDTHAHLNFSAFKNDFDGVIKKCLEQDIWVINVGTKYETSKKAVEISQKYEKGIYATVGLHPVHLEERKMEPAELDFQRGFKTSAEKFDYERYKELAADKKVVAIGETGLDYYGKPKTKKKFEGFKQKQKEVLLWQLKLAEELDLPVILHCRLAHQDLIEFLNFQFSIFNFQMRGVMHCFVGTVEELREYLALGLFIGFNGIIFKKIGGINFEEIIKNTSLDKILIETDCPYLAPPNFKEKRNNPLGVKFVAEYIAKIKNLSYEKIAEVTTQNSQGLFKINICH